MRKIGLTLLAAAIAVPMMFADDAPKTDPSAPAAKTSKKKHKKNKKAPASFASASADSV
jgi:hypothetical protein